MCLKFKKWGKKRQKKKRMSREIDNLESNNQDSMMFSALKMNLFQMMPGIKI